jgi:hypothetical protein
MLPAEPIQRVAPSYEAATWVQVLTGADGIAGRPPVLYLMRKASEPPAGIGKVYAEVEAVVSRLRRVTAEPV